MSAALSEPHVRGNEAVLELRVSLGRELEAVCIAERGMRCDFSKGEHGHRSRRSGCSSEPGVWSTARAVFLGKTCEVANVGFEQL